MKLIKKIKYREFELEIKQTPPTRFGHLFYATNNYGEPVMNQLYFQKVKDAIDDGKRELDSCLEN